MGNSKAGIYIHIPFCVRKCNYCAFLSAPADADAREKYVQALVREIELRAGERKGVTIDTVYFGGGTPSILETEQIGRILEAVRANYIIEDDAEITLEANPGTLGKTDAEVSAKLTELRSLGITRLSMGVQSMNDDTLRFLGRIHDSETVRRDFRLAREAGFDNINLDLIISVPDGRDGLEDAVAIAGLGPEHISCYSLQIEEGTPFCDMADRGEITEVDDETDRDTYHRICRYLKEQGYEHYEISNFAADSYRSRHNSRYWDMSDYIGIGLGASGFENGRRYRNFTEMQEYMRAVEEGRLPVEEEHINTEHDNISEAVFLGLRRCEGISFSDELKEYYSDVWPEVMGFAESGHLLINDDGICLTEKGIDISNRIMALFV